MKKSEQNPSSRIIRVSRISGGKDRHSKVWTVKGLRDRRVRLSVSTAIQFYDLQDRLGYDQPSKAVDWLIKAAADAIVDLPALAGPFPLPPQVDSKSTCSSASETSKSSDLSLRDAEFRQGMGKGGSFTELMGGCYADYFGKAGIPQFETSYSSLLGMGEHQDLQQFSFVQENGIPVAALAAGGGDCNVNVSIASGFGGFSRGTLQSNSQHHHGQVVHGANLPFFISATLPISAAAAGGSLESQFPGGFNGRLQLCCNEAHKHPEMKGERKG